jgi:hypothetical protein
MDAPLVEELIANNKPFKSGTSNTRPEAVSNQENVVNHFLRRERR